MQKVDTEKVKIVLVTGPSGAGRTTAIRTLEDLGFEAIDNMPLSLLPRLLDGPPPRRPIALGIDARTRDFSATSLKDLLQTLSSSERISTEVLFLECAEAVLIRRFSETRRRHPMSPSANPEDGIARELSLLAPVRALSDVLIDTSTLTLHELRAEIARLFATDDSFGLAVSLQSFSFKSGIPQGLDSVFDVRFLKNPYWDPELRELTGEDPRVAAFIETDRRFDGFLERVLDLIRFLLPAYRDEGKSYLHLGFGCTGGQHRSVTVTKKLAAALEADGWRVSIKHRELERRDATRSLTVNEESG
jgi:UPF0042 nucleotide-binding protein